MKRILAYALSLILMVSIFPNNTIKAADEKKIRWRQTATMDINLNVIDDKTGSDDLLFELDMESFGNYRLEYFLTSGEKKTLEILHNPDRIELDFVIEQGTQAAHQNKTRAEMQKYFLSVDYSLEVPVWKSYADINPFLVNEKLHYRIDKNASAKFPGAAFNINNQSLLFRADFNSKKAYVHIDNYKAGSIVPISYILPSGEVQKINALKALNGFTTRPTHLIKNPAQPTQNTEPPFIVVPSANNSEKAGSRPGIRLSFEQPKAIDENSWQFDFAKAEPLLRDLSAVFNLRDLASTANMDFEFSLNPTGNQPVENLPEAGDAAQVKVESNRYIIDIVKNEADLAEKDKIVQWSELEKSKIYTTKLNFKKKVGNEVDLDFPPFTPSNEFAYTYMEFTLKRADQKEAYLEITPYDVGENVDLEYTILYRKAYVGNQLDANNDLWLKHYQRNDDSQAKINIPVPFDDKASQDNYQVLFRFSSTNIRSQLLNYEAKKDKDVPPSMPNIVLVDNLYVTPPAQDAVDQSMPSQIQMDLVWEAMDKEELNKALENNGDAVYYELSVNSLPGENTENKYQVIKVYKVTREGTSYKIEVHPNLVADTWQGTPSNTAPQYVKGYDKIDELFRMENIILFKDGEWAKLHNVEYDEDRLTYTVTANNNQNIKPLAFPGVNYLRLRAYSEKNGKVVRSRYSIPHSFSMSMLIYEIPTTNNLRYSPVYKVNDPSSLGVSVQWDWNKNKTDFKNYKEAMLDPLGKRAESIRYVAYISQNRNSLIKIDPEDKTNLLPLVDGATLQESNVTVSPENLEKFRENKVFYFEVEDRSFKNGNEPGGEFQTQIKGLDPNEVYYIRFVVEMDVLNKDGQPEANPKKPRKSTPSIILEMTIPKLNPEPGENEKLPLAPDNFRVDFVDEEKVQTFGEWDIPETVSPNEKNYGFEFFNVEDQALAEKLKESNIPLEALMTGESQDAELKKLLDEHGVHKNNVQAFRIVNFENGWELQEYSLTEKAWKTAEQNALGIAERHIKLIDKKNSPNRVLYYYVRAVKYNQQKAPLSRSVWKEATLTTPELKRPINLTVDYYSEHDHNPRAERIIYFDIPLPEGVSLHDNYLVQIFVRGEKDADFVQTGIPDVNGNIKYGSRIIKAAPGAPNNYQRLYYKVYGLDAGKSYDIKVRLEDRTKDKERNPDGSFSYTTSPFSDVVNTRTEFDQSALDKENKFKEYIEYYVKRAEELKTKPYFDLTTNEKENIFKYRGPYAAGEMRNAMRSAYSLVSGNANTVTYYLPAEMIKAAPQSAADLEAMVAGQKVLFPYGFVMEDNTAELKEVIRKIKEYQGSIKDYSLMIQLSAGKYSNLIEGQQALEPVVSVSISVVRQNKGESALDKALLAAVDNAVNQNKKTLVDALEKELQYGIKEDKLNDILDKVMEHVKKDLARLASFQYFSSVQGNKSYITRLDKGMKVFLTPKESGETKIYFRESAKWEEIKKDVDNSVRSFRTGSFAPVKDLLAQEIADSSSSSELANIRKNRLDKVFTMQELSQSGVILGEQLIRSAARILGAGDSNDNAAYLKSQGIKVPAYDKYSAINKEKAYYILAQVYAKKQKLQLKNVRITDFNAIEDYTSIDSKFQKDILAGYHLKIVKLQNGKLKPKSSFGMKELRDYLKKL